MLLEGRQLPMVYEDRVVPRQHHSAPKIVLAILVDYAWRIHLCRRLAAHGPQSEGLLSISAIPKTFCHSCGELGG